MTAPTSAAPSAPTRPRPHVVIKGRDIPVVLPSSRDPRLRLSAVIMALQVLGQTVLGFKLSIAQILVTIAVCALVDVTATFRRQRVLVWPASGILTGNSVAFILRASGTRHGDWWSLHGIGFFVLAAALSMLSKYAVRPAGKHLFNPSNVGIVGTLLLIGPAHVFPQYLWWGPFGSAPVIAALVVIVVGALWVLRSVRMYPMAASFLVTLGTIVGLFAVGGRSFVAIWHQGSIGGLSYWADIAMSPEVLIFVFFMISDPQTAPKSPRGRVIYGMGTAVVAAALLLLQSTEFGIKLAILSSLTVMCALVPLIEKATRRTQTVDNGGLASRGRPRGRRLTAAVLTPTVVAAAIIAVAAPVDTLTLVSNKGVVNIERGLTGSRNPQ